MLYKCYPDAKRLYDFKILFSAKVGGLSLGIFSLFCFGGTGMLGLSWSI